MNMTQSKADPCVFYKTDDKGKVMLIAVCHVDDTLLSGTKKEIEWFKTMIKRRFNISDLGLLKKHLGVWYEWKKAPNGDTMVIATMDKLIDDTIKKCEDSLGKVVKEYNTPGEPGVSSVSYTHLRAHETSLHLV